MNYTYILRCGDGSLYTGWTNDLPRRLAAHSAGKGGRYTRSHLPVELVYWEVYATREEAMAREWQIKRMGRRDKLALIAQGAPAGGAPPRTPGRGAAPATPQAFKKA